ncbi:MAG: aldo/keto reductase [Candidatus Latescibacterota bacterium]
MKRRMFLKGVGTAAALPLAGCSAMSRNARMPEGDIPRRELGKTGMQVSVLGFGSHLKKELKGNPRLRDRMIKTAYERGVNFFDVYDHGGYEQFAPMGKSLEGFRKNAIVSLCFVKPDKELDAELTDALTKFKTDYIDCYRQYTLNDTRMKFCEDAKKAGKIRAIGAVSHDTATMMKYIDQYGDILDYVMVPVNFHHNNGYFQDPKNYAENDYSALIPRCERMGMGVMGIKPMGSDHMIPLAEKNGMLHKDGIVLAKAMLRHAFSVPGVNVAMPSINTMNELREDLEAAYQPAVSPEEGRLLTEMSTIAARSKGAYLPTHYKWLENWASNRVV